MSRLTVLSADTMTAFVLGRRIIRGLPARAPLDSNALAIASWFRENIRFCREDPETLVDLRTLLYLGAGDCDDISVGLAACLIRQAYPVQWGVGYSRDGRPLHVWVRAFFGTLGRWVPLDASTFQVPLGESPLVAGVESVVTSRAFPLDWT